MAEKKTSLKAKNIKYVALIILLDVAVIWTVLYHGDFKAVIDGATTWESLLGKAALGSSALTFLAIALSSLVSSEWKASLVFWKVKNVLPGCRAFTHFMPKDPRLDQALIGRQVGKIPTDPAEQNSAWYKLLKKYEAMPEVAEPHQYYLLFRDVASISFIAAVLAALATAARIVPATGVRADLLFGLQYLAFVMVARNSAHRMVTNVLAAASLKEPTARKPKNTESGG